MKGKLGFDLAETTLIVAAGFFIAVLISLLLPVTP